MKYIFILGNNPELSKAEILAVLPQAKVLVESGKYIVIETDQLDCQKIMNRLGGTIKIGEVIGNSLDLDLTIKKIAENKNDGKVKFGFSWYESKPNKRIGMEIKSQLKEKGINSRLVISKKRELSSVIVKKNKCLDFLVLPEFFGVTVAVQDFENYGQIDYGRPRSDSHSGMLPPKVAKMMINLSQADPDDIIVDPFCGSGTILMALMLMGYKNIIGSDVSAKAIDDTKVNLRWLVDKYKILGIKYKIFQSDARELSKIINNKVSVVIAEPYLGPALRGQPRANEVDKINSELKKLYLASFEELKNILKKDGRIVMIFPQWNLGEERVDLNIDQAVIELGFKRLDNNTLIYKRESQKVWRKITIWQK